MRARPLFPPALLARSFAAPPTGESAPGGGSFAAPTRNGAKPAFGDAVEVGSAGEFPARGLMNNAPCHAPLNHIELAALPGRGDERRR